MLKFILPFVMTLTSLSSFSKTFSAENLVSGQAQMRGFYQIQCLSKALVKKLIPADLILQKTELCENEMHPVVFFFGEQLNLSAKSLLGSLHFVDQYNESIMTVFSVQHPKYKKTYNYIAQIKVNSDLAWLFAQPYGGLNKKRANITNDVNQQIITDLYSNQFVAKMSWDFKNLFSESDFRSHLNLILPYFNLPIIANNLIGYDCFKFIWNFDMNNFKQVSTQIDISNQYIKNLPQGIYSTETANVRNNLSSFYTENNWSMQPPGFCE